jgi:hypothetical protein
VAKSDKFVFPQYKNVFALDADNITEVKNIEYIMIMIGNPSQFNVMSKEGNMSKGN